MERTCQIVGRDLIVGDVSRTVLPFVSIQLPWRNGVYVYAFVLRVGKLRWVKVFSHPAILPSHPCVGQGLLSTSAIVFTRRVF